MRVEGTVCYYGNCLRISPFEVGDKAVLYGTNGAGKSTLLTLFNPLAFDLVSGKELRKSLITYTSLKWPLPELSVIELNGKEVIMVRLHPFKKYDHEELLKEASLILKKYEGKVSVSEADFSEFEVKHEEVAEGYSFQMNSVIIAGEKKALITGNKALFNFVPSGSESVAYLTPHAPLVRNVLMGALKEGEYTGPCLNGFPRVRRVVEESGEISPVKVIYDTGKEEIILEPWVLGDGEKAALLYCALKNSSLMVIDSPEAFLFENNLESLIDHLNSRDKVVIATSSKVTLNLLKDFEVLNVTREGSTVKVSSSN